MITYGLTGGIGMGKTTAAEILQQRRIPVVDTDIIAREIVEPGQPALAEVAEKFGAEVIGADGRLRREELARRVFSDPASRKALEAILHPRIRQTWLSQITAWREQGQKVGVVVIPLLYETNVASHFDRIICLACSADTQHGRLLKRGWNPEQIQQRIAAQLPIDQKMSRADFVVWTEGSLAVHADQLARIFANGD
jgi:dephospho-CoA kinase